MKPPFSFVRVKLEEKMQKTYQGFLQKQNIVKKIVSKIIFSQALLWQRVFLTLNFDINR